MDKTSQSVGYKRIIEVLSLGDLPCYCTSYVLDSGTRKTVHRADGIEEYYTKTYSPGEAVFDQLVFALKYEGVNLLILKAVFRTINQAELADFIRSTPTGRYHRKLWYLYENLTGTELNLSNLTKGNYVDLIDPKRFYVAESIQVKRQRINDNLLGSFDFSPSIRRTPLIEKYLKADFRSKCQRIIDRYPKELIRDALAYLYTQETRSSFKIEQESLSGNKQERYMQLLQEADSCDYLNTPALIELQKKVITNSRFHSEGYRDTQEYVGSSTLTGDIVHLVPPKPEDLDELMEGLFKCGRRMIDSNVNPVLIAAVVAFGFVYIHPFKDGNGRIHRLLIHHILSRTGFTPEDFVFPVSAVMYQNARKYQDTLNLFSEPLLQLVDYSLDHLGAMTVHGDTIDYYRYFDATGIVENLFEFISDTIDTEYLKELDFLKKFAMAKNDIEQLVDGLPQREARLFVKACKENGYKLSKGKRDMFFSQLTDEEIELMEASVRQTFLD